MCVLLSTVTRALHAVLAKAPHSSTFTLRVPLKASAQVLRLGLPWPHLKGEGARTCDMRGPLNMHKAFEGRREPATCRSGESTRHCGRATEAEQPRSGRRAALGWAPAAVKPGQLRGTGKTSRRIMWAGARVRRRVRQSTARGAAFTAGRAHQKTCMLLRTLSMTCAGRQAGLQAAAPTSRCRAPAGGRSRLQTPHPLPCAVGSPGGPSAAASSAASVRFGTPACGSGEGGARAAARRGHMPQSRPEPSLTIQDKRPLLTTL